MKVEFEKINKVGTLIVSLCALTVSVLTTYQSMRHDRLMLLPQIVIEANGVDVELPADLSEFKFSYIMKNSGIGPARIKKIEYLDLTSGVIYKDPRLFFRQMGIEYKFLFGCIYDDEIVKDGDTSVVFKIDNNYLAEQPIAEQKAAVQKIQNIFRHTKIIVEYESLLNKDAMTADWHPN